MKLPITNDSIQNIAAVAEEQAEAMAAHAKTLSDLLVMFKLEAD